MAKINVQAPPEWLVVGAIVDYCSITGMDPTERAMVVRADPQQLPSGEWVVWLCGKAGAVSVLACLPAASNDAPAEVKVEIRAAELAMCNRGYKRYLSGEDEATGNVDHFTGADRWDEEDWQGWNSGWLAAEIRGHGGRETRDATAWPWDITRPVAGQYEEWLAAESERMRESIEDHVDSDARICEQTRHDVAASVARHADADARAAARDLSPAAIAHALVRARQVADAELIALCEEALREPGGGAAGQLAEHIAYNPDLAKWMAAYAQRRADDAAAEQGVEFPVEVGSDDPDDAFSNAPPRDPVGASVRASVEDAEPAR